MSDAASPGQWLVTIQGVEYGPVTLVRLWTVVDCHFASLGDDASIGLAVKRADGGRCWSLVATRTGWKTVAPDPETWLWSLMI